jgi:hypothetical protein
MEAVDGELIAWLRPKIETDLEHWRDLTAAYLVNVEREGDYLYCQARERVAQLEAQLAILGEVGPVIGDGINFTLGEQVRAEEILGQLAYGYRYRPGYPLGDEVCPLSGEPCTRNCEESPEDPELAGLCERMGLAPMGIRERES